MLTVLWQGCSFHAVPSFSSLVQNHQKCHWPLPMIGRYRYVRQCTLKLLIRISVVGIDGGGSVRVPSSLCGIVGLRPTVGRTSREHCPDNAFSIMAFGVLADCVADAMLVHAAISNAGMFITFTLQYRMQVCSSGDSYPFRRAHTQPMAQG
jgi:hypothetical protein